MKFNYDSFITILFYSSKPKTLAYNLLRIKAIKNYEASTLQNKIMRHLYILYITIKIHF